MRRRRRPHLGDHFLERFLGDVRDHAAEVGVVDDRQAADAGEVGVERSRQAAESACVPYPEIRGAGGGEADRGSPGGAPFCKIVS